MFIGFEGVRPRLTPRTWATFTCGFLSAVVLAHLLLDREFAHAWKLVHRQGRRSFDRGDAVLDRLLHLLEGAHLDLAHALGRHAELVG